jgi:hypothetical protein
LIIFRKYQMPPRFRKAILLPPLHPAIERLAVEPNPPAIPDEGQLAAVDSVVDRVTCHAEVLCGRLHIEPPLFDPRSLRNISRFHGIPPVLWPRVLVSGGPTKRESRFGRQSAKCWSPSVSATPNDARTTSARATLNRARATGHSAAVVCADEPRKHALGGRVRSSAPGDAGTRREVRTRC